MLKRFVLPAMALALVATPALAEPATVRVSYIDLDLTQAAGRTELDTRLDRAARRVCATVQSQRGLAAYMERRACIAEAQNSYRAQVELALNAANARRVAVLADKLAVFAGL